MLTKQKIAIENLTVGQVVRGLDLISLKCEKIEFVIHYELPNLYHKDKKYSYSINAPGKCSLYNSDMLGFKSLGMAYRKCLLMAHERMNYLEIKEEIFDSMLAEVNREG